MTRNDFEIRGATPIGRPLPVPSFQDVLAHQRRPRRLRVSAIAFVALMTVFGVASLTNIVNQG